MSVDAVAYKNGQKNNWRRFVWNRIRERTCVSPKDAIVLYLPGSDDLDRKEALRRGFRSQNMLAVERSKQICAELRDRRVTTIPGELGAVLRNWPACTPVSAVLADFQCGLTHDVNMAFTAWSTNPAFRNGSLLLNVQRGRELPKDPCWSYLRDSITTAGRPLRESFTAKFGFAPNSRSGLLWGLVAARTAYTMRRLLDLPMGAPHTDEFERELRLALKMWWDFDFPPSYKSGGDGVYMDSILVTCSGSKPRWSLPPDMAQKNVRAKISAALAVRTMRLQGTLAA